MLNIEEGDALEIKVLSEGKIIIEKIEQ